MAVLHNYAQKNNNPSLTLGFRQLTNSDNTPNQSLVLSLTGCLGGDAVPQMIQIYFKMRFKLLFDFTFLTATVRVVGEQVRGEALGHHFEPHHATNF